MPVSQVIIAVYVFFKFVGSRDRAIFILGSILFFFGIFKCILKSWDLKRASINRLVDSSGSENKQDYYLFPSVIRASGNVLFSAR
jgi:hypothetical protein